MDDGLAANGSRIAGFYKLSRDERAALVAAWAELSAEERAALAGAAWMRPKPST